MCKSFDGGTRPVPLPPSYMPARGLLHPGVSPWPAPAGAVRGSGGWHGMVDQTHHPSSRPDGHGTPARRQEGPDEEGVDGGGHPVRAGACVGSGRERGLFLVPGPITWNPGSEHLPGAAHPWALERADLGPSCESCSGRALLPYLKGGCMAPLGDGVIC